MRARLREGTHRVRASHPRYASDTRRVRVGAGQAAEVRIQLTPRAVGSGPPAVVTGATRAVNEGIGAVRHLLESRGR